MKSIFFLFLSIQILTADGQGKTNSSLSQIIDSLKEQDQSPLKIKNSDSAAKAFQRITRSNFPIVKLILDKYGFPGYDMVGKESSINYWLLVQHSDFDVPFQKKALAAMKIQVDKGNASGQNYAYLVDRIEINEGRKQIYGTQIIMGEDGTKIKPYVDSLNLDSRRLSIGLVPIKDYIKKCDEAFWEMNNGKLKKK